MEEFVRDFPRPLLIVDSALRIVAYSYKTLSVFGLRARAEGAEPKDALDNAVEGERGLVDELALATARLLRPGDEDVFVWTHRKRTYDVSVHAQTEGTFLVLFEDTTDYAISEEILMSARRYLEHILGNIPLGVIVLNSELRISSTNRQALNFMRGLGFERTLIDAIGATLEELIPGETGSGWQALCAQALERDARCQEPRQTYEGSGGSLVLSTLATPLPDLGGRSAGVMFVAEDATEKARLEDQLVAAEKLATVGQMVVTINHEINNPLSIISTNAQTLRMLEKGISEKAVDKLLKIEEQVKRIAEVTERLRQMDQIATEQYIRGGEQMIDAWHNATSGENG